MGSLVCLQALDELGAAESKAQNRLHTPAPAPAPPAAVSRLREGTCTGPQEARLPTGAGGRGHGPAWYAEHPRGTTHNHQCLDNSSCYLRL